MQQRRPLPALLLWLLLQIACTTTAPAATLAQCSGRRESKLCLVTAGPLNGSCPDGATTLILGFNGPDASWPAGGNGRGGGVGLRDCESVRHLKVTGWSGPLLTSGHLRQLTAVTSADIVDGGLESVNARACTDTLADLSLARNRISSIHELSLAECSSLISLDLSDNRIHSLPDRWLISCRSLRTLKLSGNRLTELRPDALLGAADLRELLVQKNQFQMLHNVERGFINSPRLNLIDLRNNGLFSYQADRLGFCGPANVTVRMHFAGCPPSRDTCGGGSGGDGRLQCVGSSAQLVVTFTSCQIAVGGSCLQPPPNLAAPNPTCEAVQAAVAPPAAAAAEPRDAASTFGHLGVSRENAWLLYALGATVLLAMAQLIASLAVCHRLKLRIARLQARAERLAEECPSHRYFQHPTTLCSQSGLSGRLTPSGRGPSSHCGFSQWGETAAATTLSLQPQPPLPLSERSLDDGDGCELPLKQREENQ